MRKLYAPLTFILFSSCVTRVNYLGSSYPATKKVDVFVSQSSIKKPFEVIGKGYIKYAAIGSSVEAIQRRAVEKAKLKGANAVVIEDYYVVNNTATVTTRTDSLRRSLTSTNA